MSDLLVIVVFAACLVSTVGLVKACEVLVPRASASQRAGTESTSKRETIG